MGGATCGRSAPNRQLGLAHPAAGRLVAQFRVPHTPGAFTGLTKCLA